MNSSLLFFAFIRSWTSLSRARTYLNELLRVRPTVVEPNPVLVLQLARLFEKCAVVDVTPRRELTFHVSTRAPRRLEIRVLQRNWEVVVVHVCYVYHHAIDGLEMRLECSVRHVLAALLLHLVKLCSSRTHKFQSCGPLPRIIRCNYLRPPVWCLVTPRQFSLVRCYKLVDDDSKCPFGHTFECECFLENAARCDTQFAER